MAAFSVSGYEPLWTAFTSYSFCEALNFAAISLTRSPRTAVIACQNWISVFAHEALGVTTTASTTRIPSERCLNTGIGVPPVRCARTIAQRSWRSRDATATVGNLRVLEAVRARDVSLIRVELGVQASGRPSEELSHALADRLGAIESLARARA